MATIRKKVDARIKTLIENGVKTKHRSFFVIVGDKARDQVVNLHYMLSKATVKARPSVLWCYKKELGFSSHKQKRIKQIKKLQQKGLYDPDKDDPFELFVTSTTIRYTYYSETHKILGNTYGMCVLQDFEALTPNLLARTIETVEGGGLIILMLRTMTSLKQLYTMSMDVHNRFRTESHQDVVARFNERFILSLASCKNCLVVDDELNILPISSHSRLITPVTTSEKDLTPADIELQEIKNSMKDTPPIGNLVALTKTVDQAKAVLTFAEGISEKTLRSTVTLTAARGRGKSAALGLAIAAAVSFSYSNIFVTSPSPENLKTVFDFVFKGFDALGYKEHLDYELVESTNPEFNHAIVRVNIFRSHRQTIQYIQPNDWMKLGQAELVVIDEAAAIPLPCVKKLLGPYLVFMASTINGYEGTGRSLSLKLIQQLRQQSGAASKASGSKTDTTHGGRTLREIALQDPIRYAAGDSIEAWLNQLLCLDAALAPPVAAKAGCPHPSECQLFYVNRDTLFSFHKASETFLQRMMALYVSSHYKNTPNDLQLMSDAPAHHLFVLLPPVNERQNSLPEILCVIQVCLEGEISRESVMSTFAQGEQRSGDLIPWTISQQFQDYEFASLSGARIVRIATHPDYQKMGYGARAVSLLVDYYNGLFMNIDENDKSKKSAPKGEIIEASAKLTEEKILPRKDLPPLLVKLSERPAEDLHYIGTSYGLTSDLYRFWKKNGLTPVYLRQTPNEITGEHSCIMLRSLGNVGNAEWLENYSADFKRRFQYLLSYEFSNFSPVLALAIVEPDLRPAASVEGAEDEEEEAKTSLTKEEVDAYFSMYDIKRLESYSRNLLDYHVITDLVPQLAILYFKNKFPFTLPHLQAAILIGYGLQHKSVEKLSEELNLAVNQVLAIFNKFIRRFSQVLRGIHEKAIEQTLPTLNPEDAKLAPVAGSLEDDLEEGAKEARREMKAKQDNLLSALNAAQYSIATDPDWDEAIKGLGGKVPGSISIKRKLKAGGNSAPKEKSVKGDKNASKKKKTNKSKN